MTKATDNAQDFIGIILFFGFIVLLCAGGVWLAKPGHKVENERLQTERTTLLADYHGTNEAQRLAAFRVLIHDKACWGELIAVLEQSGDKELALAFCNDTFSVSGSNDQLVSAGVRWAQNHGLRVWRRSKGYDIRYSF